MIRKTVILGLLCAVFLGGYYLGRQPGSPDILAHIESGARATWAFGASAAAAIESVAEAAGFSADPEAEQAQSPAPGSEDSANPAETDAGGVLDQ